jgi:hypothetical protein
MVAARCTYRPARKGGWVMGTEVVRRESFWWDRTGVERYVGVLVPLTLPLLSHNVGLR